MAQTETLIPYRLICFENGSKRFEPFLGLRTAKKKRLKPPVFYSVMEVMNCTDE
jgi:hypothetical protein